MRFTISYYLVILYAVIIIKPVIPFVGDKLSHEFNYMDHIATIHALYGDNHVDKEMADTSDKDEPKSTGTQKTEESIPFHLLSEEFNQQPFKALISKRFLLFQPSDIRHILLPVVVPPPKCCA